MTVPRAVACTRGWFPPATFQLRLRSVRTIFFIGKSGRDPGFVHLTFHVDFDGPSVWKSEKVKSTGDKEENLEWSDIEIDQRLVNLGLKSIIVKVLFSSDLSTDEPVLLTSWGLHFSGLWCLGTHPPSYGLLPHDSLVFQLSGSYFSSAAFIRGNKNVESNQIPRYLHIGTLEEYQTVKSYDTTLLSRLHMSQRALKQQDSNNMRLIDDLRKRGIGRNNVTIQDALIKHKGTGTDLECPIINPSALPSLRQTLLVRKFKQPQTRLSERDLQARIDLLKIRIELLRKERDRKKRRVESTRDKRNQLAIQMEEKTSNQMNSYHNLSKDIAALQLWYEQFRLDKLTTESLVSVIKQQRMHIVHNLKDIFPLGDLGGKRPTLRWISLPPSDEIRDSIRDENHASVVVGDAALLLFVIARVLDIPLRFPLHLQGSRSLITDNVRVFTDQELRKDPSLASGDFPLFLKSVSNNEWYKMEYGFHLLNKDLAQIRWFCDLPTPDMRPTLHNLHQILALGNVKPACQFDQLPTITNRCYPPTSGNNVTSVIIKNGKIIMPLSERSNSRKNSQCSDALNLIDKMIPFASSESIGSESTSTKVISLSTSSKKNMTIEVPETSAENREPNNENSVIVTNDQNPACLRENPNANNIHPPNATETNSPNIFWNDVTSRTMALSNPSSFQRPRANHF